MARALLGHISGGTDQVLSLEVTRLRRRIAALESEIVELRQASNAQPVQHAVALSLEVELHQLAEHSAPVLA